MANAWNGPEVHQLWRPGPSSHVDAPRKHDKATPKRPYGGGSCFYDTSWTDRSGDRKQTGGCQGVRGGADGVTITGHEFSRGDGNGLELDGGGGGTTSFMNY